MRGRCLLSLPVFALLLAVIGCDSFSLLEQFENTAGSASQPELKLDLPATNLEQGQTVALIPSGGTPPYSYSSSPGHTQYAGSPGYISNGQFFVAGTSIGTELIILTDSTGKSVSQTATILPPAPTGFVADGNYGGNSEVQLRWDAPTHPAITGFRLERTTPIGFAPVVVSGTTTVFVDTAASPSQLNTYRLYALAGPYQSTYVEASAKGNP